MVSVAVRSEVRVGDTRVVFIPDGAAWVNPLGFFPASGPDGWDTHASYLREDGRIAVSIGSFLVQTGGRNILIDLGLGAVDFSVPGLADFSGGALLEQLAAERVRPADVDTVVFTHLHHDHVGWTTNVAPAPNADPAQEVVALTFSHAQHMVTQAEWDRWKGTDIPTGPDLRAVQGPLAQHLTFVDDGQEVAPGVHVVATPGHTPGHLSVMVSDPSGATDLFVLVLGDVMHSQVQVVESEWTCAFDDDAEQAVRTRAGLLGSLDSANTIVAGGHFAGSVFGRVQPHSPRRAWRSARYWNQ